MKVQCLESGKELKVELLPFPSVAEHLDECFSLVLDVLELQSPILLPRLRPLS